MAFEKPRLVGSDRVHHTSHFDQLAKGFHDNRNVAAGGLAVPSRKMIHAHLLDCHAKLGCLSEDFGINHRAHALDSDTAEDITVKDFESAINVTDPDPERE